MIIPSINSNVLKNAGIDTICTAAALAALDFLNKGLLPESIIAAVLTIALTVIKYHYFPSATREEQLLGERKEKKTDAKISDLMAKSSKK